MENSVDKRLLDNIEKIGDLEHENPVRSEKVTDAVGCQMTDEEAAMIARAKETMTTGAPVSQQTATQILGYLAQYEGAIPSYRRVFKCS